MKKGHHTAGGVSVHVKGRNFSVTPALHAAVVQKMSKLDKYLDLVATIDVELSTESNRAAAHHNHIEASTRVAGRTIRVAVFHGDMYAAVDEAVDKLHRQLNRTKERMKSHSGGKPSESAPASAEVTDGEPGDEAPVESHGDPIVLAERLDLEPLFEDEALQEMQSLGRTFYVFLNAQNEHVNVLYRHSDGTFGLIQPRVKT